MKIHLHCNLPYDAYIPNAPAGYLKGFLSNHTNFQIKNIYWNLLPINIAQQLRQLTLQLQNTLGIYSKIFGPLFLSKYLYEKNPKHLSNSPIAAVLDSPFFTYFDVKKISLDFKKYIDDNIEKMALYNIDIAGFTMKLNQFLLNYYIIRQLKLKNPDIKIVIGGIRSIEKGLEFMRIFHEVDFAIWGEGEIPFMKLSKHIDDSTAYKEIPNLIYRENNETASTYSINPTELPDIDSYPFADHSDYFNVLENNNIILEYPPRIPIWGTRSCSWNKCRFCVFSADINYRERSPENIVNEIEYQSNKHNIDHFQFCDNDIGRSRRETFDKLLDLLVESRIKNKTPYHIQAELSTIRIDRDSLKKIKQIGDVKIQIGFEALTDSLLTKMMKKQDFAYNIQTLKFCQEENFPLIALNIIRGIPTETEEDVIESIYNLKFIRFFIYNYNLYPSLLTLYKGSHYYNEISKEERESKWNYNHIWSEIDSILSVESPSKYEFIGFNRDLIHSSLWQIFESMLKQYMNNRFYYKWYVNNDGSSTIEEKCDTLFDEEIAYILNPIETEILMFCDTVKIYSEIKNHFSNLNESELQKILDQLKNSGLLYFNDDYKHHFICPLSSKYKI